MIRRPPRSTQSRSSAASDVYKRQALDLHEARPGEAGELALVEVGVGPSEKQPQQADKRGRGEQSGETAAGGRAMHVTILLSRLTKNASQYARGRQRMDRHGTRIDAPLAGRKADDRAVGSTIAERHPATARAAGGL